MSNKITNRMYENKSFLVLILFVYVLHRMGELFRQTDEV